MLPVYTKETKTKEIKGQARAGHGIKAGGLRERARARHGFRRGRVGYRRVLCTAFGVVVRVLCTAFGAGCAYERVLIGEMVRVLCTAFEQVCACERVSIGAVLRVLFTAFGVVVRVLCTAFGAAGLRVRSRAGQPGGHQQEHGGRQTQRLRWI